MEQKQEMHDVVEMLLSRMRDYPEDFVAEPSRNRYQIGYDVAPTKWSEALNTIQDVLNDEEKDALGVAYKEAKRAVYMGAALKVMLSPDEPMEEEDYINKKQYKHQTSSQLVFSGNGNVGIGSATGISTSSTMLDAAAYINQIEARQQAMEAKLKAYTEQQAIRNTLLG